MGTDAWYLGSPICIFCVICGSFSFWERWLGWIGEFVLDVFDAGEAGGEFAGEGAGEFVVGEADGLVDVPQGILSEDAILGLAEDEADGGCVVFVAHEVVHGGAIEIHFTGILGLELAFLEVDDDEAAEVEVVEEKIEVKIAVADFQMILAANEGEAAPEFE